jgi:hypothetical protein
MKNICYLFLLLSNLAPAGESDVAKTTFEDFNFDGHPDKKVFVSRGGGRYTVNEEFEIHLYNPKTKSYEHHELLSQLCNPSPDAKTKQVHSCCRSGSRGGQSEVYEWRGSELVLIERVEMTEKGPYLITTTERLVKGKLREVSKRTEDADGNLVAEPAGAEQPAPKRADKGPAEVQPPPPTSKDGHR